MTGALAGSGTPPRVAGGAAREGTIRVASVPASHVYVRHLAPVDDPGDVVRLRDIPPADGLNVPGGWWPPAMLDPAWVEAHHETFDVFHVHFGFDAKSPAELRAVAAALAAAGRPLVVTVHDLRNPHHRDPALHREQLSVLLEHAAAVVTLTPGAARRIAEEWGRIAEVLPHPHVVDLERLAADRPVRRGFVVGLHAKSLRANMDVPAVATALVSAIGDLPGARLQINVHHEVFARGSYYYAPDVGAGLRRLSATHDGVELREHEYFSEDELWTYLSGIDVSVLPYRFGTHSGWLEACHDLGTAVIAPDCGFYAEQQAIGTYHHDEGGLDAGALADSVREAYTRGPAARAGVGDRVRQREELAAAHHALYARLLR